MNIFNECDKFESDWIISEEKGDKKRKLYEALFTISNGYLGMRGINEDMPQNTLPGTYIAGAFDKSECLTSEMVNFPNPSALYIAVKGNRQCLSETKILKHKRILDMKNGSIFRETIFKQDDMETSYKSLKFVCKHERNSAMIITEITPLNWSGELKIITELDGSVLNSFANYFSDEKMKHFSLESINDNYDPDTIMVVRTRDRGKRYCFATHLGILFPYDGVQRYKKIFGERIVEEMSINVNEGRKVNVVKYISIDDTDHVPDNELVRSTTNILNRNKIKGADTIWEKHKNSWNETWNISDIKITTGNSRDELNSKIRFNLYHLLMNGSETDYKHGIGIKGFTGEMYRGHYFWDTEMYIFPFFVFTNPVIARNLLVFRHGILDGARKNAAQRGYKGALYCWEDDELGIEGINHEIIRETGELRTRETIDQYHKNLAIMNAIFNYYQATDDIEFMMNYGSEILVENMRFWESYLKWDEKNSAYNSIKVMGPDEYHANINNNYYTNYLFKSVGERTINFIEKCRTTYKNAYYKISKKSSLKESEIDKWKDMTGKIYLPEPRYGVLEQFEGYFDLKDYTVKKRNEFGIPVVVELDDLKNPLNPKYTPDLIAYHEELVRMSKDMRIIKQADTVLLFNILPFEFSEDIIRKTLAFYEERTLHYSSLSPGVYVLCAARINEKEIARKYFDLSLDMDLKDIKKESENALHTPTSGEVYTIIVQGFAGVFPDGDILHIRPNLPDDWEMIEFNYLWKGNILSFKISNDDMSIISKGQNKITISVNNKIKAVSPQETLSIKL
jgi:kojibiose phosphorylase